MSGAVELYRKSNLGTVKVDDILANPLLPPKLESVQLAALEEPPQEELARSHSRAQYTLVRAIVFRTLLARFLGLVHLCAILAQRSNSGPQVRLQQS